MIKLYIIILYLHIYDCYKIKDYYIYNIDKHCNFSSNINITKFKFIDIYNIDNDNKAIYNLEPSLSYYGNIYLYIVNNDTSILLCRWFLMYEYKKINNKNCLECKLDLSELSQYNHYNNQFIMKFKNIHGYIMYSDIVNLTNIILYKNCTIVKKSNIILIIMIYLFIKNVL